jgi:hypothetical protein
MLIAWHWRVASWLEPRTAMTQQTGRWTAPTGERADDPRDQTQKTQIDPVKIRVICNQAAFAKGSETEPDEPVIFGPHRAARSWPGEECLKAMFAAQIAGLSYAGHQGGNFT